MQRPKKMKTIGILGGMSNQATVEYYRLINHAVNKKLGGWDIAETIIAGVNFGNIEYFVRNELWDEAAKYLAEKAQALEVAGADFIVCVSNTMHRVSDVFCAEIKIPFIHIADPVGRKICLCGLNKVGLLGTKSVMAAPYMLGYYKQNFGVEIITPNEKDQNTIDQIIFDELVRKELLESSKRKYLNICDDLHNRGAQGVILGCTEIFLLITQSDRPDFPMFDTTKLNVEAIVEEALKTDK